MATFPDFVAFVCDQLQGTGDVRHRAMFGEYMVYVNNKPLVLVCDNTAFIKQHPAVTDLLQDAPKGFPYPGAKEHHVLDVDDRELCKAVIARLEPVTALPKPKTKKGKKNVLD